MKREHMYIDLFHQEMPMEELLSFHRKCTHVIGLDIGGGYFSAQCLNLKDMQTQELYVDGKNSLHMYSSVGYDFEQDAAQPCGFAVTRRLVGRDAEKAKAVFTNFKAAPTDEALAMPLLPDNDKESGFCMTREALLHDAVKGLFDGIVCAEENGLGDCDRSKILLLVGMPSSEEWKKEKENYLRIIREAAGVSRVLSVSESSAAILYMMREFPSSSTGSILIIDLGAFSADMTYLPAGTRKPVEMSMELGGRLIDCNIRKRIETRHADVVLSDFDVRSGKEKHWPEAAGEARFTTSDKTCVTLTVQEMTACVVEDEIDLNGVMASYTSHLRMMIDQFAREQRVERGGGKQEVVPVDAVLIVGGAANMTPAYEAVCDCVKTYWSEAKIYPRDGRISRRRNTQCVSGGLLEYYARALPVVTGVQQLEEELRTCLKEELFPALRCALGEKLTPLLMDGQGGGVIDGEIRRWAQEPEDQSVAQLAVMLRGAIEDNAQIRNVISDCVPEETCEQLACSMSAKMSGFVREIYHREGKGESEEILRKLEEALKELPDNVTAAISDMLKSDNSLMETVRWSVLWAIIYTIPLSLLSFVLGGLIVKAYQMLRTGGEEKQEKKLSQKKRMEYAQKLCGKDMAGKLKKKLSKGDYLDRMLEDGGFDDAVREITFRLKREIETAIYD